MKDDDSGRSEPFGSPDGASEEPGTFIEFPDAGVWRDLALRATDRRARILVGRRGSGKSRYLRMMQLSVLKEGLLDYPQRDTKINLSSLRWMHRAFPDRAERLEIWEELWSCAVYAGVASFLLHCGPSAMSAAPLSEKDRTFLAEDARNFIPRGPREHPVVAVLNNILHTYSDRSRLVGFLRNPVWLSIESITLDTINVSTPVFAFIDALDDNYSEAPAESTDAQLGLVTWILRKIVDPNVSNRLHVVVTVRDVIYAALLDTDNGQRYNDRQHIRCLDWDERSSRYYLEQKIGKLPVEYRAGRNSSKVVIERWLGFSTMTNPRRADAVEDVGDYILRHTRFLPREINEIGNNISRSIGANDSVKRDADPADIRRTVATVARSFARTVIREVSLHLAALDKVDAQDPRGADYAGQISEAVHAFIRAVGKEVFDPARLRLADSEFCSAAPWWSAEVGANKLRIQDILWQHGLIGYRRAADPNRWVRYFNSAAWAEGDLIAVLPSAEQYVLHSALLDILPVQAHPLAPIAHTDG
ncbi:MAG: hypothetical protein ACHP7N_09640 [Caulobacterales bacterium]